jgi:lysophospholipase L1-like esterase
MLRPVLSLVIGFFVVAHGFVCAQERDASVASDLVWQELKSRSPWVFLGDSNTYSGGYVAILEAWIGQAADPPKLLNLGVSSETAAGTSEVDHPFKRPCVHERIDKVLSLLKPGVVFVCYGMNDGIYQPDSEENFQQYRRGMLELAQRVKASGAVLVCLTPPIFEPAPVAAKGKLGPSTDGRYAYFAPYEKYDEVLQHQAQWCLANEMQANMVVDIRSALIDAKVNRLKESPEFSFSGDGVHYGLEAHGVVADTVLRQLQAPQKLLDSYPSDELIVQSQKKMQLLRDAYLSATGKNRPGLPAGWPVWYAEKLAQ